MAIAGKTKKDVLLEFRTAEILEAARGVFAERGYGGATIDAIAVAAGVAKGTVYLYFDSKRDLFLATLRDGVTELHDEVGAEMLAAGSSEGKLRAFIETRFRYFSRNREFFRIYYTEFAHAAAGTANVQPEFQDLYERQAAMLEAVLAEGISRGELRPFAVRPTARLIYDVVRSSLAAHILHPEAGASEGPVGNLCDFVWKGIGA